MCFVLGFYEGMDIPDLIKYLYLVQAGYYIHSSFATVFMDVWKKDSVAMLFHHVLALTLIVFSYSVRYFHFKQKVIIFKSNLMFKSLF